MGFFLPVVHSAMALRSASATWVKDEISWPAARASHEKRRGALRSEDAPAVAAAEEVRVIDHRDDVGAALDDLGHADVRLVDVHVRLGAAALDDGADLARAAGAEDELGLVGDLPPAARLVAPTDADGRIGGEGVDRLDAVLVAEERLDVGQRGEVEDLERAVERGGEGVRRAVTERDGLGGQRERR